MLLIGVSIFCQTTKVVAQSEVSQDLTQLSYNQARKILSASILAYGGIDLLYSLETIQLRASGFTIQRGQSRRPAPPFDRTPYQIESVIDLKGNRLKQTVEGGFPGGFKFRQGLLVDENNSYIVDLTEKTFSKGAVNFPAFVYYRLNWLPQNALISASERLAQIRYLGKTAFAEKPHEVIALAEFEGTQISLFIDSKTNLVSKIEIMSSDSVAGDTTSELVFPAYQTVTGHKIPTGRNRKIGGQIIEELTFNEVFINPTLNEDNFKLQSDWKPNNPTNKPPIQPISENIFLINGGGYNVLAVGFKDYVFVMEAPIGEAVSRRVIEQIKKTFPNKPIKYLAVTHHHEDHAGGFRAYIAEGATLLTTHGNKNYFESIVQNKFTIQPDSLSRKPTPLKIEFVDGKRVISDGTQNVELHDIGAGPHAEEMLVAYFPKEKFIYQGDLLNASTSGIRHPNETTVHFAEWLEAKKLKVEKIIPVHGETISLDEFRQDVKKFRESNKSK